MSSSLWIVKAELRQFEKTSNAVHLAHARRALEELIAIEMKSRLVERRGKGS
ncbi:hypothetical protein [Hyphomicrobium sp.]|uniref:hypothetical protein n=1 Tax=Hyphomicrobium sp. TaxID=82 RepID=UPI002D76C6AE|nr:hypothetical protein [Hyphomicrobium sp.]HET6390363.1 hypothetical protein [Hyphomicrobium sp.]